MDERCGARTRSPRAVGMFCRNRPVPGKTRCKFHGGGGSGWYGPRSTVKQRAVVAARQALMRALGLPWYGGRPKRRAEIKMADQAIAIANAVLEVLPPARANVPDSEKGTVELLSEGVRDGLLLARDTVRLGQMALARDGEKVDRKLLGMANLTALGLTKLGLRAAEGERRDDVLGRLLAAIEAEKSGQVTIEQK